MPINTTNNTISNLSVLSGREHQTSKLSPDTFTEKLPDTDQTLSQEQRDTIREGVVGIAGYRSKTAQIEAYAADTRQDNNTAYTETTEYVKNYNAFAANLRRSDAINTYVDNGGDFKRVGERASSLPINQIDAAQREIVRHVGIANEGELNASAKTDQYSLRQTTQAIGAYNLIAQSAKDAQNHATYLQNSMAGLTSDTLLGSA